MFSVLVQAKADSTASWRNCNSSCVLVSGPVSASWLAAWCGLLGAVRSIVATDGHRALTNHSCKLAPDINHSLTLWAGVLWLLWMKI